MSWFETNMFEFETAFPCSRSKFIRCLYIPVSLASRTVLYNLITLLKWGIFYAITLTMHWGKDLVDNCFEPCFVHVCEECYSIGKKRLEFLKVPFEGLDLMHIQTTWVKKSLCLVLVLVIFQITVEIIHNSGGIGIPVFI